MDLMGMAVLGAGYWGPNLIRNIRAIADADLRWICDLDLARAERANGPRSTTRVTRALEDVLDDPEVRAVCIATPAATHVDVGLACIESGKHVMVEKPLALSSGDASKLVAAARRRRRRVDVRSHVLLHACGPAHPVARAGWDAG